MELQTEKRFHNLSFEQIQALDKVLTEVIPIHGRGNFPTLQVRAKDIIRAVKDRLLEREILVKDIRLNGATASHILVRDNGLGYRDLDIIFGVELPRQEDFQVIKEVVLSTLRDLLPCGVNRRKITCLTMKEAYVQKMVKVFNEQDRWSLISLSNNRAKTVELRFVSSLRRQFEFSVDSFQIILDRMLESYWVRERKKDGKLTPSADKFAKRDKKEERRREKEQSHDTLKTKAEARESLTVETPCQSVEKVHTKHHRDEKEPLRVEDEQQQAQEPERGPTKEEAENTRGAEEGGIQPESNISESSELEQQEGKVQSSADQPILSPQPSSITKDMDSTVSHVCPDHHGDREMNEVQDTKSQELVSQEKKPRHEKIKDDLSTCRTDSDPNQEFSFPPPAKKTCSTSPDIKRDHCPSPKLQRKLSRKMICKPEKWSMLSDLSDLTAQLFPPIEIPKPLQAKPPESSISQSGAADVLKSKPENLESVSFAVDPPCHQPRPEQESQGSVQTERTLLANRSETAANMATHPQTSGERFALTDCGSNSWLGVSEEPVLVVEAECMYGDFDQAMDHLRHSLIATHNPEEIRGGGLLKYSDLLVRNFTPASETEIKSLERYMCSRFFIDFPDVGEQQRKIEAYLQCHFLGSEEASKYDYLMTLRRVIDESTVCLMGHERRLTLNMITVLALRVLGEQNAIPNTANVTCFYQPAPYVAEPVYNSYYITQPQPPLVYHPYPMHVHMQTGLV